MPRKGKDGKYHSKVTPAPGVRPVYFEARTLREFHDKRQAIIEAYVTGRNARDATFLDMMDEWYRVVKQPRNTSRSAEKRYNTMLKKVRAGFSPSLLCRAVRYPMLQQFLDTFAGSCSDTIGKIKTILIGTCNYAVAEGAMEANYAFSLQNPPARQAAAKEALTNAQADRLRAAAARHPYGVIIQIAYYTGARLGEVLGLQWKDVDFGRDRIHIRQAVIEHEVSGSNVGRLKNSGSDRFVPLPPELRQILLPLRSLPDTFVCPPSPRGVLLNQHTFRNHLDSLLEDAGLLHTKRVRNRTKVTRDITMHWLRHNYATALYRAGIPLTVAMQWLGHADMRTTVETYTHIKSVLQGDVDIDDHILESLKKVGQKLDIKKIAW